jgi:hypothetical protein
MHRRLWLTAVAAVVLCGWPGLARGGGRARVRRRGRRRRLPAAQRGSGRVQVIDASTPAAPSGELPEVESKRGFGTAGPSNR